MNTVWSLLITAVFVLNAGASDTIAFIYPKDQKTESFSNSESIEFTLSIPVDSLSTKEEENIHFTVVNKDTSEVVESTVQLSREANDGSKKIKQFTLTIPIGKDERQRIQDRLLTKMLENDKNKAISTELTKRFNETDIYTVFNLHQNKIGKFSVSAIAKGDQGKEDRIIGEKMLVIEDNGGCLKNLTINENGTVNFSKRTDEKK